ncbi:MAG: ABC transporter permease [candidate division Zixibacteria bacterium]|nr:ABC transporter permease [candidate division Zixibacteria bacterium]
MILTPAEMRDAVLMAMTSVKTNKLRSFLTILGVMVGVWSVIAMASVIDGLNGAASEEIDSMGNSIISISRYDHGMNRDHSSEEYRNRPPITAGEAEAIKANCPSVDGVAPRNYYFKPGGNEAKYKNRKFSRPNLMGTWPDYVRVRDKDLQSGRFFTDTDEQFRLMVCVIGADVAEVLFPEGDPLGHDIRVNGDLFSVVGVFDRVKSNFGNDFENRLIAIPLSTYQKLIPWEKELGLDARAISLAQIDQAVEEITSALRIYRKVPFNKPDDFALSTQEQFKDNIKSITNYIYYAMIAVTSIGLLVGGIGVMNIMLVSVTERTREIGVRKAIGAKRSNILLQFLTEAMSLSGFGGLLGIVVGLLTGMGVNQLVGFPLSFPIFWVLVGFMVSVSVGLISGVYPAFKAARLDPIESLRYE